MNHDSESPDQIKEMCISRMGGLLDYVDECLANFSLSKVIPKDLVNRAEDTLLSVFGASSKEIDRYRQYGDQWSSFDADIKRKWLEDLNYDLKSATSRLKSTPSSRYATLGLGAVENEINMASSTCSRLGIIVNASKFSLRMNEMCRRIQSSLQSRNPDSAAFQLRKALEGAILERFRREGRYTEVLHEGKVIGLDKLLGKANVSAKGFISSKVIEALLKEKIILDISVHSFFYDPAREDFDRVISLIKAVFDDLKVNEL